MRLQVQASAAVAVSAVDLNLTVDRGNTVGRHGRLLGDLPEVIPTDSARQSHVAAFNRDIDPQQLLLAG